MSAVFGRTLARNEGSLDGAQQRLLATSHVAVVGCGGLGGFVAEELARIGIGRLTLFDPDRFSPSNCNRQLNALGSTLGENKARVAAARLNDLGTGCTAVARGVDFRAGDGLIREPPDLVVDCLDSIQARYDLAGQCLAIERPLVHGAVQGWYGQVGVQLPGYNLIQAIYPPALRSAGRQGEGSSPPSVLSFTVATIASLQAAEAVKLLLGQASSLHNSWLEVDLKHLTFEPVPG
ncbi:HesA/MoeB/ThiF family protein [Desulfogranum mediterraneum]|uniref:HesA/MoeB/ThiF family protein n=1 Tax=Desulfogranum mediterraneum TaxID=160661 RepID=UPI00042430A7|nr:HesA/MoeB/ThiF family protein [Desulfogranum mediterraneum]